MILRVLLVCGSLCLGACADPLSPAGPRPGEIVPGVDAGGGSTDAGLQCAAPTIPCGDVCLDVSADPANCGGCGVACGGGEVCSASACLKGGCPADTTECGGACVATASDARHCGGCGIACGGGESCIEGACVGCGTGISFAADVQPIFTASCQGGACHAGARPAGDLSLEEGMAYGALVGVAGGCADGRLLVAPSSPDESYLVHKIEGIRLCGGNRMPLGGGGPLRADQIATIRDWICGGARND